MNAPDLSMMATAFRVPAIPAPPNDPTSLLLNGQVGWRAQELDGVVLSIDAGALECRSPPRRQGR
jgi:hypothetical protein